MLWFYVSALAVLIGAELNAEIEHASPYGKDPGEKVAGREEEARPGRRARLARQQGGGHASSRRSSRENCDVDADLLPAPPAPPRRPRFSDWVVTGLVVGETALLRLVRSSEGAITEVRRQRTGVEPASDFSDRRYRSIRLQPDPDRQLPS